MALPTLTYDASTGSDTSASGAGPSTAVTGTTATAVGSTSVIVDASTNLSGIATDGSAVLWFNSSSGSRHLSKITSTSGSGGATPTIVIEDSITISAVSWAVGGKRQTFEHDTSRKDWLDHKPGWTIQCNTGTYSVSSNIVLVAGDTTNGRIVYKAATGQSPVLQATNNTQMFTGPAYVTFDGFLINATGTKTTTAFIDSAGNTQSLIIRNCVIDGLNRGIGNNVAGLGGILVNCEIKNCANYAIYDNGGPMAWTVIACSIHDNTTGGVWMTSSGSGRYLRCLFYGNGIDFNVSFRPSSYALVIDSCSFYSINHDSIDITGTLISTIISITNNIFVVSGSGKYAINSAALGDNSVYTDYNAFYLTSSAVAKNNLSAGPNDVTLTADPFTNKGGNDFSLNTVVGGGVACRNAGLPQIIVNASTNCKVAVGPYQGSLNGLAQAPFTVAAAGAF